MDYVKMVSIKCHDPFLCSFIDTYTFCEFEGAPMGETVNLPPLGFPVIQFHYGLISDFYLKEEWHCHSLSIGQLTRHVTVKPASGVKLLGIDFKPYGLYNLLGISPQLLKDHAILSCKLFGEDVIARVVNQLKIPQCYETMVVVTESFLKKMAKQINRQKCHIYDEIVDLMVERKGLILLETILNEKVKLRNLQRYFKKHIGISPKQFLQVLRHKYVVKKNFAQSKIHWNDPDFDGYYYDLSHFNRDFKKFSSQMPIEYKMADYKMAELLV
ncbi:MAG: AraC family transcriptional regulator [Cyclobacteriaceae bacterium]|nr:AraC family transcriptional regulator [Cyclobacteriaceae bacterium]